MKIAPNIYTTYAEAEKDRKAKQKQFPDFYTRIHTIPPPASFRYCHLRGKTIYKVEVL